MLDGELNALSFLIGMVYVSPLCVADSVLDVPSYDRKVNIEGIPELKSRVPKETTPELSFERSSESEESGYLEFIEREIGNIRSESASSVGPSIVLPHVLDSIREESGDIDENIKSAAQEASDFETEKNDELFKVLKTFLDESKKKVSVEAIEEILEPENYSIQVGDKELSYDSRQLEERRRTYTSAGKISENTIIATPKDREINRFLGEIYVETVFSAYETGVGLAKSYEASRNTSDLKNAFKWLGIYLAREEYFYDKYGIPVDIVAIQKHTEELGDKFKARKRKSKKDKVRRPLVKIFGEVLIVPLMGHQYSGGKWGFYKVIERIAKKRNCQHKGKKNSHLPYNLW